jgi:hypothetical protein
MSKKYIVYDAFQNVYYPYDTLSEAQAALCGLITEESHIDGLRDDHLNSFIATQTHAVEFEETDNKDNYPCPHHNDYCSGPEEDCPEDCDEEEWPYTNEFDYVSEVRIKPIEEVSKNG